MKNLLVVLLALITMTGLFSSPANSESLEDVKMESENFYLPAAYYYESHPSIKNLNLDGKGSAVVWIEAPVTINESDGYYFLLSLSWDVKPKSQIKVQKALHIHGNEVKESEVSNFRVIYGNEHTAYISFKYKHNGVEQVFKSDVPIMAIADSRYAEKLDFINQKLATR